MRPKEPSCPTLFPFSSNCIFPVSPSFIVFRVQEVAYPFVCDLLQCSPSLPTQKAFAVFCFTLPKQKTFGWLFCSLPWSPRRRFLTEWPKMGTAITPSSYKTLETMAEVQQPFFESFSQPIITHSYSSNGTRCSQLSLCSHPPLIEATRLPHLRYLRCSREPIDSEIPLLRWLCESPLRYRHIRSRSDSPYVHR